MNIDQLTHAFRIGLRKEIKDRKKSNISYLRLVNRQFQKPLPITLNSSFGRKNDFVIKHHEHEII